MGTVNKRIALLVIAILVTVLTIKETIAATDGMLGATSTATTVITLVIPEVLRISGISDLNLGAWTGGGALSANTDICVYSNASGGNYHVRITDNSSRSPGGFSVQNASATADIPFVVKWNGGTGTTGNFSVVFNTSYPVANANTKSFDCSVGGKSANLYVGFAAANLQAAPSGAYSSTLIMEVDP